MYFRFTFRMSHIHQQKLLHRDIKPSNMVKVGDKYKIADFGLVKDTVSSPETTPLTAIGQGMGTPGFLAPEAVLGILVINQISMLLVHS